MLLQEDAFYTPSFNPLSLNRLVVCPFDFVLNSSNSSSIGGGVIDNDNDNSATESGSGGATSVRCSRAHYFCIIASNLHQATYFKHTSRYVISIAATAHKKNLQTHTHREIRKNVKKIAINSHSLFELLCITVRSNAFVPVGRDYFCPSSK